jgi:hypothetical protein
MIYDRYIQFNAKEGIRYGDTHVARLIAFVRSIPHKTEYRIRKYSYSAHRWLFLEPHAQKTSNGLYRRQDIIAVVIYYSSAKCSDVSVYREDIYRGMLAQPPLGEPL